MIEPGYGFAVNTFFPEGSDERQALRSMLRLGPLAEELGFDSVWVGDHVLWHTPIVDTLSILAAYAVTTTRIRIGTAILLLGLRQPAIAAKALTTLSLMSDGRLVIGVGVGGEHKAEFDLCGVDHGRRGRALDEALRFLLAQWDPEATAPKLTPRGPRPALLVGGGSDAARRRVVEFGAGWIGAWVSPRRVREEAERLREAAGERVPIALNLYLSVGPDGEAERAAAAAFLAHTYAADPAPLLRNSAAGTPAECAERIAELAAAGVDHFILRAASWDQEAQLKTWSSDLLPLLPRPVTTPETP